MHFIKAWISLRPFSWKSYMLDGIQNSIHIHQ